MINERLSFGYTVSPILGTSFLLLTFLLGISIAILIWRLKVKEKMIRESGVAGKAFSKEIWNLILILILFSTSFLIRWIFDKWLLKLVYSDDNSDVLCRDSDG